MIPGLHEAVQRMDHAAFSHLYIVWASDNHQAPIPVKDNDADIKESWIQILDVLGILAPEIFLKKLVPYWAWVLKTLAAEKQEATAQTIRDLLSGKIGQDAGPGRSREGTLLRISPIYKKLSKIIGKISEESLTGGLKKYIQNKRDVQLFLITYLAREALFNYPKLPQETQLAVLKTAIKTQLTKEFGAPSDDFCNKLSSLWLYGLYFAGAPVTAEKLILFLDLMIEYPDLATNTLGFTGSGDTEGGRTTHTLHPPKSPSR